MIIRNNQGEVIAKLNTAVTQDGTTVITNTLYNAEPGRPPAGVCARQPGEREKHGSGRGEAVAVIGNPTFLSEAVGR